MPHAATPVKADWLSDHTRNVTSQSGEDGILEKIFESIPDTDRWCVEFGAWDGKHCSNTYQLIVAKGYSAVLVEADPGRFRQLQETYHGNRRVTAFNEFVGLDPETGLDAILSRTPIPVDFDLLSVDIDGNDYHVWERLTAYRPKVVVIEYNPTIPNAVEFVQPARPDLMYGASLRSLCKLAKRKGYELVAATFCNGIFVEAQYFELFGIRDNSVDRLRRDDSAVTYVFQGYDGTIFLRGSGRLHWHDFPLYESRFQQLPRWLRRFPESYLWWQRVAFRAYRLLTKALHKLRVR